MKNVRPLSRLLTPAPGEAFTSYVERLAAKHKVELLVMLNTLGITEDERYERLHGYGILLDDTRLERFCSVARLSRDAAAKLLLSSYDGIAVDLSGVTLDDPDTLRKRATTEWAYFSGSHACPHCIREDGGAWKLAWKLPWSFVCTKHNCYLVANCPTCTRRLGTGRRDRSLSPLFVRRIPKPGFCNNPLPDGAGRMGRASPPCGYPLSDIQTIAAGRSTLHVQKTINEILNGDQATVFGAPVSSLEYFNDLRSLGAFILYCAEADDLDGCSAPELDAFRAFALDRNSKVTARKESASPRNGERTRVVQARHESPELMAAVTCIAVRALGTDAVTTAKIFRRLAEQFIAKAPTARWEFIKFFGFSERLAPVIKQALSKGATFDRTIGSRSVLSADTKYTFSPSHVPQLIWQADYDKVFAAFFPRVKENLVRRFCSMSLVKLCGDYTWAQSGAFLGLTDRASIRLANHCVNTLAEAGAKDAFGKALHRLARRLSADEARIDYGLRRERLSSLTVIPETEWASICNSAGISTGHPGRRSRYAAVLLWAELTQGDWTLAPGLDGENSENAREVYRTLSKTILPQVRPFVLDYGKKLVDALPANEKV